MADLRAAYTLIFENTVGASSRSVRVQSETICGIAQHTQTNRRNEKTSTKNKNEFQHCPRRWLFSLHECTKRFHARKLHMADLPGTFWAVHSNLETLQSASETVSFCCESCCTMCVGGKTASGGCWHSFLHFTYLLCVL